MLIEDNRIRYPDPAIKVNDTVKINIETGEYKPIILRGRRIMLTPLSRQDRRLHPLRHRCHRHGHWWS
jgi:hypothetical protein